MRRWGARFLTLCLATALFSLQGYAGRKHSDVENIGNRKVSGRIFGILPNWVSLEKEVALGAQIAAEFEQTARLVERGFGIPCPGL